MSACGGDNDFIRCDIPVMAHMNEESAWSDFIANPGDWEAFERMDLAANVFIATWGAYSTNRRVEASREDNLR